MPFNLTMIFALHIFNFSILGFFEKLGQDAESGVSWLYNNTLGAFSNFITTTATTIVLSPIEAFFVSAIDAVLAIFGGFLGYIEVLFGGIFTSEIDLANNLGIVGVPVAIWIIVALVAFGMIGVRVVIDAL